MHSPNAIPHSEFPTPHSDRPRMRVLIQPKQHPDTELFELRAAIRGAHAPPRVAEPRPRGRHPHVTVKVGSVEIPIYKGKDNRFTIAWYEGIQRKRTRRAHLTEAKKLAELKATAMANGQTFMASMTQAHRATFERVLEILAPTGKSPELAVAEYAEAVKLLPPGATLKDSVLCLIQYRPRNMIAIAIPQLVEEMLEAKRKEGIGKRWLDSLANMSRRFAKIFDCPFHLLSSADLDNWLHSLAGGLRNRANHRATVQQIANFAKKRNYLPKTWNELDQIAVPKKKDAEIKILTPEQMVKLLAVSPGKLIPFIALTAFAGIRHQEMCGEKAMLDWRNLDFEKCLIYVPRNVGKTGDDRIVPMQQNLFEWLQPFARRNGPVWASGDASKALSRAKRAAGIAAGKNETRNTLRKSFISYRLAVIKDVARVAEEAGNSVAKIKSNYKRPVSESEGERWFAISPTEAGILQLPLPLR